MQAVNLRHCTFRLSARITMRYAPVRLCCAASPSNLPVGIFVDLDNVSPPTHSRSDARHFARPLHQFARAAGKLCRFSAWGNLATRSFAGPEERESRKSRLEEQDYQPWDGNKAVTGLDQNNILRCGICGQKMSLTKKQRAAGMTAELMLAKHMRQLHDREEQQRLTWRKQGHLKAKDIPKMVKYRAAQVGFSTVGGRNDLFTVLREQGIRCHSADNVDKALMSAARKWMESLPPPSLESELRGCLVIVSEDGDFAPLLSEAKSRKVLAVSLTPQSGSQTRRLIQAADLVLVPRDVDALLGLSLTNYHLLPQTVAASRFIEDVDLHAVEDVDISAAEALKISLQNSKSSGDQRNRTPALAESSLKRSNAPISTRTRTEHRKEPSATPRATTSGQGDGMKDQEKGETEAITAPYRQKMRALVSSKFSESDLLVTARFMQWLLRQKATKRKFKRPSQARDWIRMHYNSEEFQSFCLKADRPAGPIILAGGVPEFERIQLVLDDCQILFKGASYTWIPRKRFNAALEELINVIPPQDAESA